MTQFNQSRVATSIKSGRWITVLYSNTSVDGNRNNKSNVASKKGTKDRKITLFLQERAIYYGGERMSVSARHRLSRTLLEVYKDNKGRHTKQNTFL